MKSLLSSKTFWIACAQALVGAVAVFATAYPTVGILLVVKSLLDVVIRLYTTEAVVEN